MSKQTVKLVVPTDFDVLEAMSDGKRQTAPNLAELTGNSSRYMNNRLAALAGAGYVEKVGPSDSSKMYAITEKCERALEHRDLYDHDIAEKFERVADGEQSSEALNPEA